MTRTTTTIEHDDTDQARKNASGERGVHYPGDDLESAIGMLYRVRGAIGFNAARRELVAQALGYKTMSGHAARRLGSLSHYGLIERAGTGATRISPLGKSILVPTHDEERRKAIVEAARRPSLYSALLGKYSGHALPALLPNLLIREHGVHPTVAEAAAATFRETVEFAGLLRNGVLYAEPGEPAAPLPQGDTSVGRRAGRAAGEVMDGSADSAEGSSEGSSDRDRGNSTPGFTIPLDGSGRMATIHLPLPVSTRDLRKIGAWLDYMSAVVEDEEATPNRGASR